MPKFNQVCPSCGKSFQADTEWIGATVQCPICAKNVVIAISVAPQNIKGHVTIEKTKKSIKIIQLFNFIAFMVGVFMIFYNIGLNESEQSQKAPAIGLIIIIITFFIWILTRIARWWNHD